MLSEAIRMYNSFPQIVNNNVAKALAYEAGAILLPFEIPSATRFSEK
jgi:hypothetical protein